VEDGVTELQKNLVKKLQALYILRTKVISKARRIIFGAEEIILVEEIYDGAITITFGVKEMILSNSKIIYLWRDKHSVFCGVNSRRISSLNSKSHT
jgi:hypothetical protein